MCRKENKRRKNIMRKISFTGTGKRITKVVLAIIAGMGLLLAGTLFQGCISNRQLEDKQLVVDRLEEQNSQYKTDLEALQEDYDSLKRESNSSNSKNSAEVLELQQKIDQLEAEKASFGEGTTENYILQVFYEDGNRYQVEEENWTFYSDTMLQNPIGNDLVIVSPVVKNDEVKNGGLTHHIYTVRTESGLVYSAEEPRLSQIE